MEEIAIVTGGSSGLGFEIAKLLLGENINVCIIARNEKQLDFSIERLKEQESDAHIVKCVGDVGDELFIKDMYQRLLERYRITYLFNVAGIGTIANPEDTTKGMIDTVLDANLVGLMLMTSNVLTHMNDIGYGHIINVISTAAKQGNPDESIYCASKWGARGYTESLISWAKGTNIKVMGVYPGGINTPFWSKVNSDARDTSGFMQPDEVARQIVFAALDGGNLKITDLTINRI